MQIHKKHHPLVFLLMLLLASCIQSHEPKKQKEIDQTTKMEITKVSVDSVKPKRGQKVLVGDYDSYENLPPLVFDSISEATFNKLKAAKFLRKVKPEQKGNEFYIETAIRKHSFRKYKDYGEPKNWCGYELKGYYPALKLFVLTENSTAEHMGFGELFLLDSVTDYQYMISSIGDGSVETPIPSPNNKYLVYYYNEVYEHHNSQIDVLKINSKTKPEKYLTAHSNFYSSQFAVEQIIWKSDQCFYLKGYKEIYDEASGKWRKEFSFYRTTFQ